MASPDTNTKHCGFTGIPDQPEQGGTNMLNILFTQETTVVLRIICALAVSGGLRHLSFSDRWNHFSPETFDVVTRGQEGIR
jgi:hypothetical protein